MFSMIKVEVDEKDVEAGAKAILKELKPTWDLNGWTFKIFTEGITNKLVACQHKDDSKKEFVVLVRVYGQKTDLIIDRELELENMILMNQNGCAKPVHAKFNNGIVYGYIPGVCLDENTVRDPVIARLIAKEMVRIHAIEPKGQSVSKISRNPCLFTKLKRYIDLSPDDFSDERYKKDVPSKKKLYEELNFMETQLEKLGSPVVFCHNDLLLKNIVLSREEGRTYFIDFEYGAFNYEAYDIGNHFCEYAGIDTVDYKLYPNEEYQTWWLRCYLEEKYRLQRKDPASVTDRDVNQLYVQTNQFALMAHMFWGVWALIQAKYSTIDFDYLDYAVVRLNEYFAKKEDFLNLNVA